MASFHASDFGPVPLLPRILAFRSSLRGLPVSVAERPSAEQAVEQ